MFMHLNCIFCAVFVTWISKGNNRKQRLNFKSLWSFLWYRIGFTTFSNIFFNMWFSAKNSLLLYLVSFSCLVTQERSCNHVKPLSGIGVLQGSTSFFARCRCNFYSVECNQFSKTHNLISTRFLLSHPTHFKVPFSSFWSAVTRAD